MHPLLAIPIFSYFKLELLILGLKLVLLNSQVVNFRLVVFLLFSDLVKFMDQVLIFIHAFVDFFVSPEHHLLGAFVDLDRALLEVVDVSIHLFDGAGVVLSLLSVFFNNVVLVEVIHFSHPELCMVSTNTFWSL